jgi:hypothetical protein
MHNILSPFEIRVSIHTLSLQGQTLLRGGVSKEKVELMRLHTLSAATAVVTTTTTTTASTTSNAPGTSTATNSTINTSSNSANNSTNIRRNSIEKDQIKGNVMKKEITTNIAKTDENMTTNASNTAKNTAIKGGGAGLMMAGSKLPKSSGNTSNNTGIGGNKGLTHSNTVLPKTTGHQSIISGTSTTVQSTSTPSTSSLSSAKEVVSTDNPFRLSICDCYNDDHLDGAGGKHIPHTEPVPPSGRRYSFQPPTPPTTSHGMNNENIEDGNVLPMT